VVHAGDVLAEMNDGDLKLEKLRHVAERHQHELELDKALGEGNLAAVNIARAQIAEKDAEIELADAMLERAMMRAPFDGLVTAGDLSHSVGLPVGRGDALFELAPLDRYRVSMVVDEADVDSVRPGAAGELLLTALPEHPFRVTVKSVTPVARAAEGINGFEVVAVPEETDPRFRPAMEGIAKIEVGERSLLWMWTHKLVARARILVWGVLP
jgi:multidrug resistance efflux pump